MNIRELYERRLDIVKEQKAKDNCPVIGTLCSYAPVEILNSFDIIPLRIWGESENLHKADALLQTFICPPVRHLMALGLEGHYNFLDGIVHCYTCDATCGLFNIWVRNLKPGFSHLISLPYMDINEALSYTIAEFGILIGKLESFTRKKFSPESLKRSITLYNEVRSLMREVYYLRKGGFRISYSDICAMNICCETLPAENFLAELRKYVKTIKEEKRGSRGKLKILISGSIISDTSLMDFIEEVGGNIVADDACIGLRTLRDVIPEGDPLESLAGYYLARPPCASRADFPSRKTHLLETLTDFNIDAVVFIHQKFCDPHLSDHPFLKKIFDEAKIPHMQLELEGDGFTGSVRTRIESFFEMLERR
ncbi:MAG: 2-hydroxyacyl-CoA dehydratase [Desulfobacteraceae bacterium]|nr:MAG: 2-hydroxyacyl-CoA dehydratase [Desulfobacteraceae bacterium]